MPSPVAPARALRPRPCCWVRARLWVWRCSCRFAEAAKRGSLSSQSCVSRNRKYLPVLLHRAQVARQLRAQVVRRTGTAPSPAGSTESGRTHPSLGFSGLTSISGTGLTAPREKRAARVSRFGHRSERCTSQAASPYKIIGFAVTIVAGSNNEKAPLRGRERAEAASCGTGTRTPTSGTRIRRPTIRRSRRARAGW